MKEASVILKFPTELDAEIERFIEETGIYTNKSEFIKEACRDHLKRLNDDVAIATLRLEKLLAKTDRSQQRDSDIDAAVAEFSETVDPEEPPDHIRDHLRFDLALFPLLAIVDVDVKPGMGVLVD